MESRRFKKYTKDRQVHRAGAAPQYGAPRSEWLNAGEKIKKRSSSVCTTTSESVGLKKKVDYAEATLNGVE